MATLNTRGSYVKGISAFEFGTADGATTTAKIGVVDNTGFSFNGSADSVAVRTDKDLWARNGGTVNKGFTFSLNTKDLKARGTDLAPGDVVFDVMATLWGAGDGSAYHSILTVAEAVVTGIDGNAENNNNDVEGGTINFEALLARTAATGLVPFSWSVWATT